MTTKAARMQQRFSGKAIVAESVRGRGRPRHMISPIAGNRMSVGLGRRRELEGYAVIVVLFFGGREIEIRESDLAGMTGR